MTQYDFTPYSIDEIISRSAYVTTRAIEEVSALRAKATEYDRIAELIDGNRAFDHISIYDQIVNLLHDESGNETIDELRATVAAQARRLEEARKVIERCSAYIGSIDHGQNTKSYMMCDAWLAANAPQAEQEQAK